MELFQRKKKTTEDNDISSTTADVIKFRYKQFIELINFNPFKKCRYLKSHVTAESHRGDLRVLLHGRSSEPNSFAYELSHVGGCECLSIMGGPDTRLMAATYKICLWVHDRWLPFFYCWSPLVGFGFHLSSNSLIRPRLAHQSQCYWAKSVEMPRYGQRQRNFKSTIGRTHNWCKRCRLLPKKNFDLASPCCHSSSRPQ